MDDDPQMPELRDKSLPGGSSFQVHIGLLVL